MYLFPVIWFLFTQRKISKRTKRCHYELHEYVQSINWPDVSGAAATEVQLIHKDGVLGYWKTWRMSIISQLVASL